jgi:hypothetical protein
MCHGDLLKFLTEINFDFINILAYWKADHSAYFAQNSYICSIKFC